MAKNNSLNKRKKLEGFSLMEVMVVLCALSVIITISFGDVFRMFNKRIEEADKIDMLEIQKALEIYAEKEGQLPENDKECDNGDADIWTAELAKYSNMTANRMCFDQSGMRRRYQMKEKNNVFSLGSYKYKVYNASVTSIGLDKTDDSGTWNSVNAFPDFVAKDDDIVIKVSDRQNKLDLYQKTLARIETVEEYLERYARSRRSIAMAIDEPDFDNKIFYPSDGRTGDPGDYFTVSGADASAYESGLDLMEAVNLTKIIGLPDSFGRDALTGETMYYISNPGADRSDPCTDEKAVAPFYPPAIIPTSDGNKPSGC